jgi:hypothetical protein
MARSTALVAAVSTERVEAKLTVAVRLVPSQVMRAVTIKLTATRKTRPKMRIAPASSPLAPSRPFLNWLIRFRRLDLIFDASDGMTRLHIRPFDTRRRK